MQIFINRGGQQFGPFTLDQINQALAAGQLLPNDFAFYEGLEQWTPLSQIQGVVVPGAALAAAPAPIQSEIAATPAVSITEETAVVTEPVTGVAGEGTSNRKRIIVIAGISVGVVTVICVLLFVYPGFLKSSTPPDVEPVRAIIPPPDQPSEPALQLPDVSNHPSVSYFRDIKFIFEEKCEKCHGPKKKNGKLDMSNPQGLAAGADGEPISVAGKPEESLLVESILNSDEPMPPDDEDPPLIPLTEEEKKKIIAWIAQGAKTDN